MASRSQMSDVRHQRVSVLAQAAVQGRFGADRGAPGVMLSVIHPLNMMMVVARQGKSNALTDALAAWRGADARWAGPDQYYIVGQSEPDCLKRLAGMASLIDQSHGRIMLALEGPRVRDVLTKGTPVDLDPGVFPVGKSAVTQMAHIGVHLTRTGKDRYEFSIFRGFAESFWDWLTRQAEEFGYQVD
jgi:methylglutamate dehydrogenase subunit D